MCRLGSTVARLKLKEIDGGLHKRWSMWLNSMQREEPYLALTCIGPAVKAAFPARGRYTGAAWLSSARVVRCWVKSRNERNPYVLLPPEREFGALRTDCLAQTSRKVGMTSSQYGPYGQGCTRTTMPGKKGSKTARWSKSPKTGPSSDCRLQLADMKLESLVMAHQLRRREYVPRPCTHRPSHHESRLYPKSPC